MNVLMVTSKVKEGNVADAEAAVDKLIQALQQAQPAGVRYAVTKLSDGVTIVAFLEMEPGQEHPLRDLPAYVELVKDMEPWRAEPATAELMTVLGSYHLFSA
jgi:sulfite reductase alpha subunit-like flavoprotein